MIGCCGTLTLGGRGKETYAPWQAAYRQDLALVVVDPLVETWAEGGLECWVKEDVLSKLGR